MSGYGIEIDRAGRATAFGDGWFRELGVVSASGLGDWQATNADGRPLLEPTVNQRELAIQTLVRAAGLGNEYVLRNLT